VSTRKTDHRMGALGKKEIMDGSLEGSHSTTRRNFMKGLAAITACTLLPGGQSPAQTQNEQGRLQGYIDVHHHYVSPTYFASLSARTGTNVDRFKGDTVEMHLADMDKAGVTAAMLAQYSGFWLGDVNQARRDARELNEWAIAKMVDPHKNRFGLFASLPMPDVEGTLHEIEYAFDTLKADGVSIITSYDDKWLGDKSFEPVFEELNRRSAVVFTHPLEPACCKNPLKGVGPQTLDYPTDTTRTILSLLTSNTGTKYPNVKFIFSHAGGTLVSIAQRVFGTQVTADSLAKPAEANSKLYQARHFYYDTAGSANPVQLQSLKLLIPPSQLLFGTDYPFGNLGATVSGVQTSGLTGDELRGVFWNNSLNLFAGSTRTRLAL
jgi:predicted TIM-barrel fold metal-dependent hydrolase